jgi:hypothetical protein
MCWFSRCVLHGVWAGHVAQNDDASRVGYKHTCASVIPLLTKLLQDHASEVRVSASKTLVFLADLLDEDDMEKQVCMLTFPYQIHMSWVTFG